MDRFIDTSGWAAWTDRRDQFHALAVQHVDAVWRAGDRLITSNWVLDELTALLTSPIRMPKPQQVQLLQDLRSDPGVFVVSIDNLLEASGWGLWESRLDKDWTLTDCLSFKVMTARGITEALTGDKHFEQAGFIRLLK